MKKTKLGRPKTKILPVITLPRAFRAKLFKLLLEGKTVEVKSMGIFEIVSIPQKVTYHNFSKKRRVVRAYKRLKFTQSSDMKKALSYD